LLIKDGVQSIDDEFLEWFVKNPSCEFVEVDKNWNYPLDKSWEYKLRIIPKEEPKQEETLEEVVNNFKKTDVYINEIKQEQDKKLYSEQEVIELLTKRDSHHRNTHTLGGWKSPKEWFEQFKKK
jgi:hypothetical protein